MNYSISNNLCKLIPVKDAKSPTFRLNGQQEEISLSQKEYLIETARRHPLKRARILLHDELSSYHVMYIVKIKGCQEFIKKSKQKHKSIEVLEGSFSLKSSDQKERILISKEKIDLDLSRDYEFNVLSEYLVIMEIIDHS